MSKKLLLTLTALVGATFCAAGLAACDKNGEKPTAHSHVWSGWTVESGNEPTETAEGKATRTCSAADCDAESPDKEYTLPALNGTDYSVSGNSATCSDGGTATYSYSKNNVTVSFSVATAKLGHNHGEWVITPATAEEEGSAVKTCQNDGCEDKVTVPLPVLTDNGYTVGEDTATCTEIGHMTYSVTVDGTLFEFEVETRLKDHVLEPSNPVPAKCTEDGLEKHWTCTVCGNKFGDEYGDSVVIPKIPATGHTHTIAFTEEDKGYTTANETEGTAGTVSGKCTVCGESESYSYDKLLLMAQHASPTVAGALELGKTAYLKSAWTGTEFTSGNVLLSVQFAQAGKYVLSFEYPNGRPTVQFQRNVLDENNQAISNYTDFVSVEQTSGSRPTVISITFNISSERVNATYKIPFVVNKAGGEGFLVTVEKQPGFVYGENVAKITKENEFADSYVFVSEQTKQYSITIPKGVTVDIDGEILDGVGIAEDYISKNFTATAGVPVEFIFSSGTVGNYTVTIGDALPDATLTVGEKLTGVSFPAKTVVTFSIDVEEEKTYVITITDLPIMGQSALLVGLNVNPDYEEMFGTNATDGTGVYIGAGNSGEKDGITYARKRNENIKLTVTLKKGDVLCITTTALTNFSTDIILEEVA